MTDEIQKVFTAYGQLEADMVRLMLEAAGITVIQRRESAGTVYGLTVGPLGEVHLYVPSRQFEEARELIEAMQSGELENQSDEGEWDTDEVDEDSELD